MVRVSHISSILSAYQDITRSMAVAASLSISIDPQLHLHFHHHHSHSRFLPKPQPISFLPKSRRRCLKSSDNDPLNLSPSTSTTSIKTEQDPESTSILQDPFRTNRFLTNDEYDTLKSLENFSHREELGFGSLQVRVMRPDEIGSTSKLIAESFAESLGLPAWYVKFLGFLVKQALTERRAAMPHAATLVGFYREELVGTVKV